MLNVTSQGKKCLRGWLLIHINLPNANLKQFLRIRILICKFTTDIRNFQYFLGAQKVCELLGFRNCVEPLDSAEQNF